MSNIPGGEGRIEVGSREVRPPWLHWTILAVLLLVTRGLFALLWLVVLGYWVWKTTGRRKALGSGIASVLAIPVLSVALALISIFASSVFGRGAAVAFVRTGLAVEFVVFFLIWVWALFTLRLELGREPIGCQSSYWGTVLLGIVCLQYSLGKMKRQQNTLRA